LWPWHANVRADPAAHERQRHSLAWTCATIPVLPAPASRCVRSDTRRHGSVDVHPHDSLRLAYAGRGSAGQVAGDSTCTSVQEMRQVAVLFPVAHLLSCPRIDAVLQSRGEWFATGAG